MCMLCKTKDLSLVFSFQIKRRNKPGVGVCRYNPSARDRDRQIPETCLSDSWDYPVNLTSQWETLLSKQVRAALSNSQGSSSTSKCTHRHLWPLHIHRQTPVHTCMCTHIGTSAHSHTHAHIPMHAHRNMCNSHFTSYGCKTIMWKLKKINLSGK